MGLSRTVEVMQESLVKAEQGREKHSGKDVNIFDNLNIPTIFALITKLALKACLRYNNSPSSRAQWLHPDWGLKKCYIGGVIEQDTISCLVLVQPRKTHHNMTYFGLGRKQFNHTHKTSPS